MLVGDRMNVPYQPSRFSKPWEYDARRLAIDGIDQRRFNVTMETTLELVVDLCAKHRFTRIIGLMPFDVMGFLTYRFWTDKLQAAMGCGHDDVWCMVDESLDIPTNQEGEFTDMDHLKSGAYLAASMQIVDDTWPYFDMELSRFIYPSGVLHDFLDADLRIDGIFGNVAHFSLTK